MPESLIGQTIGNYQIMSEIGRGGMAIVYKGYQTSLNRYVAIKVLPPQIAFNNDFADRFKREALSAAQMRHPNIVQIYETGEWNGYHYIVMEYVDGESLHSVMQKRGALDAQTALQYLTQIASALDYAHAEGVVHRDVKPSNILIDSQGRAMLTDFGIAKTAEATRLTQTGTSLGTPEYMSPEQAEGESVDRRSDLYSLGVILFQMLAGRIPFGGPTPTSILYAHVHKTPPSLRQLNPAITPPLETVVLKSLAKRPEDRFPSAGEMVKALREAMAGKSVPLPPIPPVPTGGTGGRSNSTIPIVVGVAGGLVLIAALIVFALLTRSPEPTPQPVAMNSPTAVPVVVSSSPTPLPTILVSSAPVTATPVPPPPTAVVIVVTATPPPATPTLSPTATPAKTPTPAATSTPIPSPTPSGPVGMMLVPAGVFYMGAADGDPAAQADEKPGMFLETPAYWIDKFEVSVGQYKKCVDAGKCDLPSSLWSAQNPNALFGNPNLAAVQDYPITFVSHGNASQYCIWVEKRLPYEYEWEKAARGQDMRTWPWGSVWDGYRANAAQGKPGPLVVTSNSNPADDKTYGCGVFGVCNMVGNVREWVADYYQSSWYRDGYRDVQLGTVGKAKVNWNQTPQMVIRGGSYKSEIVNTRVSKRASGRPADTIDDVGFRCAMDSK